MMDCSPGRTPLVNKGQPVPLATPSGSPTTQTRPHRAVVPFAVHRDDQSAEAKAAAVVNNDDDDEEDEIVATAVKSTAKKGRGRQILMSSSDDDDDDVDDDETETMTIQPPISVRGASSGMDDTEEKDEESQGCQRDVADNDGYTVGEVSCELDGGFSIPRSLYDYLFEYQRAGVAWLWRHHLAGAPGCILGDDMGLGKSIQTASFIRGLLGSGAATHVLLVAPVTLLEPWMEELAKHCRCWPRGLFHGTSVAGRKRALQQISRSGGVSVTSYGMVQSNAGALSEVEWDYVILDEGHKIKNAKNKVSQALRAIPSRQRVILTGTPVQNNLQELWALFDYLFKGALLGTAKEFKSRFEVRVSRGTAKDATDEEKDLGLETSAELHSIIEPYLLRREKKDVLATRTPGMEIDAEDGEGRQPPSIPTKSDLVVWLQLASPQERQPTDRPKSAT